MKAGEHGVTSRDPMGSAGTHVADQNLTGGIADIDTG
jgi:hypothetical protein